MTSEERAQEFHLKAQSYPDRGSVSDWMKQILNQSVRLPIGMFFLRRSFRGKTNGGVMVVLSG